MRMLLVCISAAAIFSSSLLAAEVQLQTHEDLLYRTVGSQVLKLDLYRPDTQDVLPAVVMFHGGGWKHGDKESIRVYARQLAKAGFVAATIQYRLSDVAKFPAQVEDAKCAVRWLRANAEQYRLDPKKVGAMGASAGGHLALMLGLTDPKDGLEGDGGLREHSSKVQAVVNFYGPFDLTLRDWRPAVEQLLVDFLGGRLEEQKSRYQKASPIAYVDSKDPPVLTFHGDKDDIVPFGQAVLLDETLKKHGVRSTLVKMEGEGHGWLGAKLLMTQRQAIEFLNEHLK